MSIAPVAETRCGETGGFARDLGSGLCRAPVGGSGESRNSERRGCVAILLDLLRDLVVCDEAVLGLVFSEEPAQHVLADMRNTAGNVGHAS